MPEQVALGAFTLETRVQDIAERGREAARDQEVDLAV